MKKSLTTYSLVSKHSFSFGTKTDDFYELLGLRSTKCLRETCKTSMPVYEKTSTRALFAVVLGHMQKEILKENGIQFESRMFAIEDATSTR